MLHSRSLFFVALSGLIFTRLVAALPPDHDSPMADREFRQRADPKEDNTLLAPAKNASSVSSARKMDSRPPSVETLQNQGVNIGAYCIAQGFRGHYLDSKNFTAYGWSCINQQGRRISLDMRDVCQWQYGSRFPIPSYKYSDPFSWSCRALTPQLTSPQNNSAPHLSEREPRERLGTVEVRTGKGSASLGLLQVEVYFRETHRADGTIEIELFKDKDLAEPLGAKATVRDLQNGVRTEVSLPGRELKFAIVPEGKDSVRISGYQEYEDGEGLRIDGKLHDDEGDSVSGDLSIGIERDGESSEITEGRAVIDKDTGRIKEFDPPPVF